MPSNKSTNNPYADAASAYGDNAQQNTPDQRELEGRVLLKSAKMIQDLKDDWDQSDTQAREAILKHNRQIWLMFYDTALENPEGERPDDLRSNIVNLANFIFKREIEVLTEKDPDKLEVLININREIAAGLMSQNQNDLETGEDSPQNQSSDSQSNVLDDNQNT